MTVMFAALTLVTVWLIFVVFPAMSIQSNFDVTFSEHERVL